MKNSPFTMIPKSILGQSWAKNPIAVYLYTWLSLNADSNGQIITSLRQIAKQTKLSLQQVRTAYSKLLATQVVTQVVTQKSTQVATVITISFLSSSKDTKKQSNTRCNTSINTSCNTNSDKFSCAYKNDNNISCLNNGDNKGDKEKEILSNESTKKGDESPTRATDDLELRYKKWMDENFPLVQKMQKPLTFKQYQKIIEDGYTVDEITSELEDMENWSKLKTKTTANLTLRNWLKKDYGKRNYTTQHAG